MADLLCLAEPGWHIVFGDGAIAKLKGGNHGYDNAVPEMAAIVIAAGPAFRRGVVLPAFDNVDVYALVMRLLNLAPLPSDGDITPLLPALAQPQPAAPEPIHTHEPRLRPPPTPAAGRWTRAAHRAAPSPAPAAGVAPAARGCRWWRAAAARRAGHGVRQADRPPVIRKLASTGSVPVGRLLSERAAAGVKPIRLETGGHGPLLVFDGADIEAAAVGGAANRFSGTGKSASRPPASWSSAACTISLPNASSPPPARW